MPKGPPLRFDIMATDRTRAAFRSVRRQGDSLRANFARGLFAGATAGAVAFLNPIGQVREALEDLDALGKRIRTTGLSSDLFQGVQLAAEEESVSLDRLNRVLEKFPALIGEAKTGRGEFTETLKNSHPDLVREIQAAESIDAAFKSVADAVSKARSEDEKALITKAAFGARMISLVRVLDRGASGLDATAQKARELGITVDKDLLDRAEDLQNEFGVASRVIDLNFKQSLVNLAPAITSATQGFASISRGVRGITDSITAFFDKIDRREGFDTPVGSFASPSGLPDFDPDEFLKGFNRGDKKPPASSRFSPAGADNSIFGKTAKLTEDEIQRMSIGLDRLTTKTGELGQAGQSAAGFMADAFVSFGERGSTAIDDVAQSARDLLRDMTRLLLNKAFTAILGNALGGGAGIQLPNGSVIPDFNTTTTRAPGFATGGRFRVAGRGGTDNNLVQFRASRGEVVDIHKGDPGRGGGTKVEVNVHNAPAGTETSDRQSGDLRIVDIILPVVKKGFASGDMDDVMGRFGASPVTSRRSL